MFDRCDGTLAADDLLKGEDRLLTPGFVAELWGVDAKTVTRWAAAGRIGSVKTPGGHRRFRESEVRALLEGEHPGAGFAADTEEAL